jgi:hypothetical protein
MDISRNIIIDLLPLYVEGEASQDTKELIEKYLEKDPELALIAKKIAKLNNHDLPLPLTKEHQMEAYQQAQKVIMQRTVIWGVIIALVILSLLGFVVLANFMIVPSG